MPTIGEAIDALEAQLFVGRERNLAAFEEWLRRNGDRPEILNVSGPGGVGKTALLAEFGRIASQAGRRVLRVDGRELRATADGLLSALGGGRPEGAVSRLNRAKPLLLIDTFEELDDLTPFLQAELLPKLDTGVKVVVAGRYPLGRAWSSWQKYVRPMPLGGLSAADARTYLTRRGIDDAALRDQIVRAAGGMPLALSLAADMVQQLGVRKFESAREWRLATRSMVERMLDDVKDPALREALEACSVVRHFDEATLAAVTRREDVSEAFDRLCRLSVVRPAEHGLTLHDDLRRIVAEDLQWRAPARHRALRLRALAYFRERARSATPAEREWLITERLYLWGNEVARALMFRPAETGAVETEPGAKEDHDRVLEVWEQYTRRMLHGEGETFPGFEVEQDREWLRKLLAQPALRLRVARVEGDEVVGFSTALPIYRGSVDLVLSHPVLAPLLRALFDAAELSGLPESPESTRYQYLLQAATSDRMPEAAQAALLRDLIGLLARGEVYLTTVFSPDRKRLCEAMGFRRIPGASTVAWDPENPIEGYVLDLTEVGVEAWIDAIVRGRRPPRVLSRAELEEELQAVLINWCDDAAAGSSALVELASPHGDSDSGPEAEREPADAVRDLVLGALARVKAEASRDQELAYRALELAYIQKGTSHERLAERLSVSRSTFYRLLRRGVQGVAAALADR